MEINALHNVNLQVILNFFANICKFQMNIIQWLQTLSVFYVVEHIKIAKLAV